MKPIDSISNKKEGVTPTPFTHPRLEIRHPQQVNLLKKPARGKRKILKIVLGTILAIIIILGGLVIVRATDLSSKIFVGTKTTFFGKIMAIFSGGNSVKLTGEDLGQINVLLLGIGGEGHDGPYLTDTMILAQIRPDIGEVTLTSIPRDYWTKMPNGGFAKINQAFSDGYVKDHDWGQAGQAAITAVQNISGLQIPYFAVLDFSGFEKAVDQVGGVDLTVDRTFTDYAYPDNGTGYLPPQTFLAGPQHMDGAKALIFARSRHAAGIEGSDFARSLRQQKIIQAFKQKVFQLNIISDAEKINSLLGIFADHFHTNISPEEMYHVYTLVKEKNIQNFLSLSLDPSTGLICPEIAASDGAYILTPCPDKSETDVENFFKNSFSIGKLTAEKSLVWLGSSTGDRAAYNTALRKLTDAGITVYQLSYSKDNLPQTIVYQENPKPATTEFIKNELGATEATLPPPGVNVAKEKVDIIVILGLNAQAETAPKLYVAPPARVPTTSSSTLDTTSTSTKAGN